jgi:ABC-type uncharacterized transport system auxiliary subunit
MRLLVVTLTAVAGLAGCAGFTREAPPPATYRLAAPELPGGDALGASLAVPRPVAAPGLDGERIAAAYPDRRLDYYAGARWGGELTAVVQASLVESLRGSGRLKAVQGDAAPFEVSHVLQVEIQRFEARYAGSGPPTVEVVLAATLGRRQGRVVLASFTARAAAPAAADRMGAIAAAFDAAYGQAATELAARTLAALEAERPPG